MKHIFLKLILKLREFTLFTLKYLYNWRENLRSIVIGCAAIFLGFILLVLWTGGVFEDEQEQIAKLTSAIVPDSSIVFDRKGRRIGEYFDNYHVSIPFDQIPKEMINAVLSIEDRRFFEHKGVNWRSMGRAFVAVATSGRMSQGGSTITMQLVRNYLLTREKKVSRKVREIFLSYLVEKNLSKERILELYLNTMYMGHGAYGVGAASRVYFSRPLKELGTHEFALLAGLFQAPSAFDPHRNMVLAKKRQRIVLNSMVANGVLTKDRVQSEFDKPIRLKPWDHINESLAPFFLSYVRTEVSRLLGNDGETINGRGLRIYTSLDKDLQEAANQAMGDAGKRLALLEPKLALRKGDRLEAALLSTNPNDGGVMAMVGGRNFQESQFNRTVQAKRSPGSAFKPLVFSLALERGMSWSDSIQVLSTFPGGYSPKNYGGETITSATMIRALAKSYNTPVVSLASKIGIEALVDRAKDYGIRSSIPREMGVSIGGFSSTMLDLARMYGVFASGGIRREIWAVSKIVDRQEEVLYQQAEESMQGERVMRDSVAQLLRSGLSAVLTSGTATSAAHMSHFAVGKTGTSDGSRDNWFCGYSSDLVTLTWVGTDGHSSLAKIATGASLSLPQWIQYVSKAQTIRPSPTWWTPPGLVAAMIDLETGAPSDHGVLALFEDGKVPTQSQAAKDIRVIEQSGNTEFRKMDIDD